MNLVFSLVLAKMQINTSNVKAQLMTIYYVIIILLNNAIKIIVLRHVVLLNLKSKNVMLVLITLNSLIALLLILMNSSIVETLLILHNVMVMIEYAIENNVLKHVVKRTINSPQLMSLLLFLSNVE
jgi:hypothetical protein